MVLEAGEDDVDAVVGAGVGGEGDGGGGAALLGGEVAEAADEGVAVFARHADVADEHVGALGLDKLERLGGVGGVEDVGVAVFEQAAEEAAGVGLVVDDDDGDAGDLGAGFSWRGNDAGGGMAACVRRLAVGHDGRERKCAR